MMALETAPEVGGRLVALERRAQTLHPPDIIAGTLQSFIHLGVRPKISPHCASVYLRRHQTISDVQLQTID